MKILLLLLLVSGMAYSQERVVVIGGSIGQIISDLDETEKVIAIDLTTKGVAGLENKTILGMPQSIGIESLINLRPDLVIYGSMNENKKLVEQLKLAKIRTVRISENDTLDGIESKVQEIATLFKNEKKSKALIDKLKADLLELEKIKFKSPVKVAFIYARGSNQIFLAGTETPANAAINAMGLVNAFSEASGFRPISSESLVTVAPDYLIMLDSGVKSLSNVWEIPGLSYTEAGKKKRLITVDSLGFLGFVPKTPRELIKIIETINHESK